MAFNTAMAQYCAHYIRTLPDAMTRAVCLTALESVGNLAWANGMTAFTQLLPGNQMNTARVGCVCYAAPVAFALMNNAVSIHEANVFFDLSQQQGPASNTAPVHHVYGRIVNQISDLAPDTSIPAGSMVFHGDATNPCRHVTLSVGNGYVVSCWSAQLAASAIAAASGMDSAAYAAFNRQVDELLARQLSPDTLVVHQRAFSGPAPVTTLKYTNAPFWQLW